MPIFRPTLIVILAIYASSICIKIFREKGVNYFYIFEFDPNYRVREQQMLKISMTLLSLWSALLFLTYISLKFDLIPYLSAK